MQIGELMRGAASGIIVESKSPSFSKGDHAYGFFGWQEYWVGPARVATKIPQGVSDADFVGLLGVTGLTAYVCVRT